MTVAKVQLQDDVWQRVEMMIAVAWRHRWVKLTVVVAAVTWQEEHVSVAARCRVEMMVAAVLSATVTMKSA